MNDLDLTIKQIKESIDEMLFCEQKLDEVDDETIEKYQLAILKKEGRKSLCELSEEIIKKYRYLEELTYINNHRS